MHEVAHFAGNLRDQRLVAAIGRVEHRANVQAADRSVAVKCPDRSRAGDDLAKPGDEFD